jgi:hypothetical protein
MEIKLIFFPMVPCIRKGNALLQDSQASGACLCEKSSAKMEISLEHGLSVTDRNKSTFSEGRLPRCHSLLQTSH